MKYWIWNYKTSNLKNEFGSQSHNTKSQRRKLGSGRVGGFSHGSRWQQLTTAARGSRSRQQMATAHGTDRGSRWQPIAVADGSRSRQQMAADRLLGVGFGNIFGFGRVRLQAFGFGSTHSRLVLFCVLFVCFTVCDCVWIVVSCEVRLRLVCSVRVCCKV